MHRHTSWGSEIFIFLPQQQVPKRTMGAVVSPPRFILLLCTQRIGFDNLAVVPEQCKLEGQKGGIG